MTVQHAREICFDFADFRGAVTDKPMILDSGDLPWPRHVIHKAFDIFVNDLREQRDTQGRIFKMRGFDKDLEFAEVVWSLVDDYVDVATEDKAAVELCEELRKNGYTDEAKRLEIRLNGRAEQFVADLTPEQWNEISKRKFQ